MNIMLVFIKTNIGVQFNLRGLIMKEHSEKLLGEIYKGAKMGMQATKTVLSKSSDKALNKQLESQYDSYLKSAPEAEKKLIKNNKIPKENDILSKATLWGSIQMGTIADTGAPHIAELMINGSTMGIVDMTKSLNEYKDADMGASSLARRFIKNEESNIEQLKKYL